VSCPPDQVCGRCLTNGGCLGCRPWQLLMMLVLILALQGACNLERIPNACLVYFWAIKMLIPAGSILPQKETVLFEEGAHRTPAWKVIVANGSLQPRNPPRRRLRHGVPSRHSIPSPPSQAPLSSPRSRHSGDSMNKLNLAIATPITGTDLGPRRSESYACLFFILISISRV
jgi:hypothetical protein